MLSSLSQRLLPLLQLTRMALVFTAIADSATALLLRVARHHKGAILANLNKFELIAIAVISVGLYGYGMSLNDIIDRRRDSQISPMRPLPSGRIGVVTAHVICALLASAALLAGLYLGFTNSHNGWFSFGLVLWTGLLITFYDTAGKYLVAPGLITLGLIRFFHSIIPAPDLPLLWHPLTLLNHVAILSTLAYAWEQKRPALTRSHTLAVVAMLAFVDLLCIVLCIWLRPRSIAISPALLIPAGAAVLFVAVAFFIRKKFGASREAGQTLMLYGLLWLIVYDAAFTTAYASWIAGLLILALLPIAYAAVHLMRAWSKLLSASQRPDYKRAGV